jgi:hypothetical protein
MYDYCIIHVQTIRRNLKQETVYPVLDPTQVVLRRHLVTQVQLSQLRADLD